NEKLITRKFGYTKIKESKLPIIDVYISQLNQSITYLAQRNAVFLFGSDTPSGPSYTNPAGYNSMLEMQHLLKAGLSLRQLFQALTINNAQAFHLDKEIGTIEPGKKANLLIVEYNPLETAAAYHSIQQVIVQGRIYERNFFKAK